MKNILLAAAAISAIVTASPVFAQESDGGPSLDVDVDYENAITTKVKTDVTYTKDVALTGDVTLDGQINVNSSAVAVNDVKQIMGLNEATYREENELNGENGYVHPIFGGGWSEPGNDPRNPVNGSPETQVRVGYFAPIINTIEAFTVGGEGNIGVNLAAGYMNMQLNSAVLASAETQGSAPSGWAEASTTSLQALGGVAQYGTPEEVLNEDDPVEGGGGNNFRDRNTVAGGTISGAGNIGVNAAAGSFNQQANLMTLAVATDSALAEANAGLVQISLFNAVEQQDSINSVGAVDISDATGNIGVNFASGVGNQQLNSLTIATSLAGPGVTEPQPPTFPGDPS